MIWKFTPQQEERVCALIPTCCNWDRGKCLMLDMPCPQQLSLTRINCRYFREAVLPAKPKALSSNHGEQLRRVKVANLATYQNTAQKHGNITNLESNSGKVSFWHFGNLVFLTGF